MTVEGLVIITRAAALFPTRPHVATIRRWATEGIRGIKLRTLAIGGQRFVNQQMVDEFLQRLNADPSAPTDDPAPSRRAADVSAKLAAAGF